MLSRWNPDKHLRIRNPRLNLALRMSWYCMVASSIGGILFSLAFLVDFPKSQAENLTQALVLALFFGVGTALHQRLLASILIGAFMAFVSSKFFKAVANPWLYQFAMALTAATVVHLFAPIHLVRFYLTELAGGEYPPLLETTCVIGVYAGAVCMSLVMARKYIREVGADNQPV